MNKNIQKLIIRYLTNAATAADLDTLSKWVENPQNKQLFKQYVQTHVAANFNMIKPNTDEIIDNVLKKIKREKSIVYKLSNHTVYKYAAAAVIIISLGLIGFWYTDQNKFVSPKVAEPVIVNNQIEIGSDKATLTLEDGSVIELNKNEKYRTTNAESNGEELIYKIDNNSKTNQIAYNTLTIPRGGQFQVKLSDGTKVWLNSETQIKYPVEFEDSKPRKVELIYGEAYFDVSPSTENKGSRFQVLHNAQTIEVLGTEFNIKAYKNEANIFTTLVEGKVAIKSESKETILSPGQQSNLELSSKDITVQDVDVYNATAWKDGIFSFEHLPLKEMMKTLSRWYDMDVVIENANAKKIGFNGVLRKDQDITEILNTIKSFGIINNYEINNKTIKLK